MDQMEYERWKAQEESYRARRRKRKRTGSAAIAQAWDDTTPPIKFEYLIKRWQQAIVNFLKAAEEGQDIEGAWKRAAPSHHSAPISVLGEWWENSLQEVYHTWRKRT